MARHGSLRGWLAGKRRQAGSFNLSRGRCHNRIGRNFFRPPYFRFDDPLPALRDLRFQGSGFAAIVSYRHDLDRGCGRLQTIETGIRAILAPYAASPAASAAPSPLPFDV